MSVYDCFCILWACVALFVTPSFGVSFYGDSLVWVPSTSGHYGGRTTDISLQFKTHRSSGILLSSTGSSDYIVVQLSHGAIEVKVELGSGELVVQSPPGLKFDDSKWHDVKLIRETTNLILTLDGTHKTIGRSPGRLGHLNVGDGIHVGQPSQMFKHNSHNFRGCLKDVVFNGQDLFYIAKSDADSRVQAVTWDCDQEFDARSNQPITFINSTSFIAFPHLKFASSVTFSCDIKTRSNTGLLMFNTGVGSGSPFVAIEIKDGRITVTMAAKRWDVRRVESLGRVNDGIWHSVFVTFSLTNIKLATDGSQVSTSVSVQKGAFLKLAHHLYVGGASSHVHSQVESRGLTSQSMIGCVRNIEVGRKIMGFLQAQVSNSVGVDCLFTYPCSLDPCAKPMECLETGIDQYSCNCPKGRCGSGGGKHDSVHAGITQVDEGRRSLISPGTIRLSFDYKRFRLRESDIVFRVAAPAKHGRIDVGIRRKQLNQDSFTLLDLNSNKVFYTHNGCEETQDTIQFVIDVPSFTKRTLAEIKNWNFTLIILVKNINDIPQLVLPKNGKMKLVRNTKLAITSDIVLARDNDSSPDQLVFEVVPPPEGIGGYFENSDSPGMAEMAFTQKQINEGQISFIHTGGRQSWFMLRVGDGITTSTQMKVEVVAIDIDLQPLANSGVRLHHTSLVFIQTNNLSYTSGAPSYQNLEVRYTIKKGPLHGRIQRKKRGADPPWQTVKTFTQKQINKNRIRYEHSDMTQEEGDSFTFVVECAGVMSPESIFQVSFIPSVLSLVINSELVLDSVMQNVFTSGNLLSTSNNPHVAPNSILYVIVSPPRKGQLLLKSETGRWRYLSINSNFSQEDVQDGRLQYKLHRESYVNLQDEFQFRIFSETSGYSKLKTFHVKFRPEESDLKVINKGLDGVLEGRRKVISDKNLYIKTENVDKFQYSIVTPLRFGVLQLIDPETEVVDVQNTSRFTNDDLISERLTYLHDDTENGHDWFLFEAAPEVSFDANGEAAVLEIAGNFSINITLTNDHAPVRVANKVFTVVKNGQRLLTPSDLYYSDPDVNFNSSSLRYTRRGITNGEIVNASNPSQLVHQFFQSDIENSNLIFRHQGANFGRAVIIVTDGQFYATGLFEIQATEPFVNITKLTGGRVRSSGSCIITSSNISIDTNMGVGDDGIQFVLTTTPRYGSIVVNSQEAQTFTYDQLNKGLVEYVHGGSYHDTDFFKFVVRVEDLQIQDRFDIRILSETDQTPPTIINNWPIRVEEGGVGRINSSKLFITHPESEASNLKYTVLTMPKHGYLKLLDTKLVRKFTQEDVDVNILDYVHTKKGFYSDTVVVDVTNGIHTLQDVVIQFDIIPAAIPLQLRNITVREGASKAILENTIQIASNHFSHDPVIFTVTKQPSHGRLERTQKQGVPVDEFTWSDIEDEFIYYTHDDSDTEADQFSIIAKLANGGRPSKPGTVFVKVLPENDQVPIVVNNVLLHAWFEAPCVITNSTLLALDEDTGPRSLKYIATTPSNGMLVLKADQSQPVMEFSQKDINDGKLLFMHSGDEDGKFYFQVNDGVNFASRQTFHVTAERLNLTLEVNTPLQVYPNTRQPITDEQLRAMTNNKNQTQAIVFSIQSKPEYGRLVLLSNNLSLDVNSFTQDDINKGLLYYEHTEGLMAWTAKDKVILDITTPYANRLKYVTFNINLSYENLNDGNKDQLIRTSVLNVKEGETAMITTDHLDLSPLKDKLGHLNKNDIKIVLESLPKHGQLSILDSEAETKQRILPEDLTSNALSYQHDDSDTVSDSFNFSLQLGSVEFSAIGAIYVFNISVEPVNDGQFQLETKTPHLQLVQGAISVISHDILWTSDPDTEPNGIKYSIVNGPKNGYVAWQDNTDIAIRQFTQDDIDSNRVVFVSDWSTNSGSFNFKVTDGAFPAFYKIFHINVIPLSVTLVNSSVIDILQGESTASITSSHLAVITNGNQSDVLYNITHAPSTGSVMVNDKAVGQFRQSDIDARLVKFVQTDSRSSQDLFNFTAFNHEAQLFGTARIIVKAMVTQNPISVSSGQSFAITTDMLDASKLASVTGLDPYYNITEPPRHGSICLIERNKRDVDSKFGAVTRISGFWHSQVADARIVYIANDSSPSNETDGFSYVLTADNVPPAYNRFEFNLTISTTPAGIIHPAFLPKFTSPMSTTTTDNVVGITTNAMVTSTIKSVIDLESVGDRTNEEPGNVVAESSNSLIIALVSLAIIILIGVLIGVYIYRRRQKSRFGNEAGRDQQVVSMVTSKGIVVSTVKAAHGPSQPTSPPRSPDVTRCEVSSMVPQCRVTPLICNEDQESRATHELLENTPVGSYESTSNFDESALPELVTNCKSTNPVLQRDQYWV